MPRYLTGLLIILMLITMTAVPILAAHGEQEKASGHTTSVNESAKSSGTFTNKEEHAVHNVPHIDGKNMHPLWAIPFVSILLAIALLPLLAPHFWHDHFGKVSLAIGLCFFIAFTAGYGYRTSLFYLVEVYLGEFLPFIILLLALFTVAGGIRLKGELTGTPLLNTILLLIGTVLSSVMGTTGSAMLMIRPVLRANGWRKHKVHVVVFFIFLVANAGGSLTPLGDPPLFLGFLKGVNFMWTVKHMFPVMTFTATLLLIIFFIMDTYYFRKEKNEPKKYIVRDIQHEGNVNFASHYHATIKNNSETGENIKLEIEGKINFLFLAMIVGTVVFSGLWKADMNNPDNVVFSLFGAGMMSFGTLAQMCMLLAIVVLSMKFTSGETRKGNEFSWDPILEVAKLFATIFITMIMPIAMLKAGAEGPLKIVISQVIQNGKPVDSAFFWATGILSSFLDNAPTYLVFFNTAGGDAVHLMTEGARTLIAISAGAVFMGANSYIGNAPNFMVKSIAEESGVTMPSFFGYIIKYSLPILIPVFILVTIIFFR